MKKKFIVLGVVLIIIVAVVVGYAGQQLLKNNQAKVVVSKINGISNFTPSVTMEGTYLLYYPSDSRISQKQTIVKEVKTDGQVVAQYEIDDKDMGRMLVHQKPNDQNKLFISFFGEATIDNYFMTYDITERSFKKIDLDYFDYDVGVDHIMHYGEDTLFQTLVSHKTGEQNLNNQNEFNVSVANFTNQKSFETFYGHAPKWSPLLSLKDKILYGVSGYVDDKMEYQNAGIAVVDLNKNSVIYTSPKKNTDLIPMYSNENHAFVMDLEGTVYTYDKDLNVTKDKPFKEISSGGGYDPESVSHLMIDDNKALMTTYGFDDNKLVFGELTYEPTPKFVVVDTVAINKGEYLRILYQDITEGEIYIIKGNENSLDGSVLILDSKTLKVKETIPVKQTHLLDLVVKTK